MRSIPGNKKRCMTLDHFKEKHYMEEGTTKRNDLEKGYKKFTVSALRQKARLEEE